MAEEKANQRRGRILRLKQGYNPNSSSIGSYIVYAMPAAMALAMLAFSSASAVIFSVFILKGAGNQKNVQRPKDQNGGEDGKS